MLPLLLTCLLFHTAHPYTVTRQQAVWPFHLGLPLLHRSSDTAQFPLRTVSLHPASTLPLHRSVLHSLPHPLLHHPLALPLQTAGSQDDPSTPAARSSLARCASWDVICHADWISTIQEFWEKYGDRRRNLNWLKMLAVYDDSWKVAKWRSTLKTSTKNYFGRNVTAELIIRVMKQQLRRPDKRAIYFIVDAMLSLDEFSRGY